MKSLRIQALLCNVFVLLQFRGCFPCVLLVFPNTHPMSLILYFSCCSLPHFHPKDRGTKWAKLLLSLPKGNGKILLQQLNFEPTTSRLPWEEKCHRKSENNNIVPNSLKVLLIEIIEEGPPWCEPHFSSFQFNIPIPSPYCPLDQMMTSNKPKPSCPWAHCPT